VSSHQTNGRYLLFAAANSHHLLFASANGRYLWAWHPASPQILTVRGGEGLRGARDKQERGCALECLREREYALERLREREYVRAWAQRGVAKLDP